MSDLISQAAQAEKTAPLSWLADFQQLQNAAWLQQAVPTRKTEAWKYTPLNHVEKGNFFGASAQVHECSECLQEQISLPDAEGVELDCYRLVFVNGFYAESLSTLGEFQAGVSLCRFSDANEAQQNTIRAKLGTIANDSVNLFTTLNNSQLQEGVLLSVDDGVVLDKPLRILWLGSAQAAPFSVAQRILVLMGANSQAMVLEQHLSDDAQQNSFTNGVTELSLGEGAQLHHYRLHQEHESVLHIGGVFADLGKNSLLNSFHLAFGSVLTRIDIVVNHRGPGAHSELSGVYLPRNQQYVDYHTCIEHRVPNCTSNEVFRGIISDSARAVFNGRIHIHRDAQKTSAKLSNKNLLTSNRAEVDSKPELEIYADDVLCAHGTTISQLEDEALHYLRTRGISEQEARVLLSFGFINALIEKIPHPEIAEYLRPRLAVLFARDPELLRHIV